MAKRRKIVYNGHHGIEGQEAACLWCGKPTTSHEYVVNPGGDPVLKCCCEEHFENAVSFVNHDVRMRPFFYVSVGLCAITSWVAIAFLDFQPIWTPIPFVVLSALILIWPRVLPRYEYYLPLGLVKTRKIVRSVALAALVFSLYVAGVRLGVLPG